MKLELCLCGQRCRGVMNLSDPITRYKSLTSQKPRKQNKLGGVHCALRWLFCHWLPQHDSSSVPSDYVYGCWPPWYERLGSFALGCSDHFSGQQRNAEKQRTTKNFELLSGRPEAAEGLGVEEGPKVPTKAIEQKELIDVAIEKQHVHQFVLFSKKEQPSQSEFWNSFNPARQGGDNNCLAMYDTGRMYL